MRKLALGLNSIPSGNVPGSENVEVPNLNEEDIESANKTAFNAIEQSGFDKEEGLDKAVIAYNKVFNYRLGNKMRNELIKLNKALNGIGYKNLIKIANTNDYDLYQVIKSILMPIFSKDYETGPGGDLSDIRTLHRDSLIQSAVNLVKAGKFNSVSFAEKIRNTVSEYIGGLSRNIDKIIKDLEPILLIQSNYLEASAGQTSAAQTSPVVNKSSVSSAGVTAIPIEPPGEDKIDNYIGKTYKSKDSSDKWFYKINERFEVEVSKDNSNFKKLTPRTMGVPKWNTFAKAIINYMSNNQLEDITTTVSTKAPAEPVAPAATPTPPAVAPTAPEAAKSSTGGSVTETVNGKPAVSIGTFGKDQIFLIVESVKSGKPEFYIKDGKTGEASLLGANDGRVRSSLGPVEIDRLSRRLLSAGIDSKNVEGFKDFMNLQRMRVI